MFVVVVVVSSSFLLKLQCSNVLCTTVFKNMFFVVVVVFIVSTFLPKLRCSDNETISSISPS